MGGEGPRQRLVCFSQCSRGPTPARSRAATPRRARAAGASEPEALELLNRRTLQLSFERQRRLLEDADHGAQFFLSGSEGAGPRVGALVAHAQRFPPLVGIVGEPAQRRVEDERTAGRPAIARVDVRGHLLQVLNHSRMELGEARRFLAQPRCRFFRALLGVARGGGVAIEMIDDPRVEGRLLLQIGRDGSPDEAGETASPSRPCARERPRQCPTRR